MGVVIYLRPRARQTVGDQSIVDQSSKSESKDSIRKEKQKKAREAHNKALIVREALRKLHREIV
jgi:hypothetical protein